MFSENVLIFKNKNINKIAIYEIKMIIKRF